MATRADLFCTPALFYCGIVYNGNPVSVAYTGAAPGMVNGVVQVNFQVTLPLGPIYYYLSVDAINSDGFTVYTRP
jgi:uncharacterized protein (TIGR03437 family)